MSDETEYKKKRDRSPNYPGLGLEQALERARRLHGAQGRHAAPADVAIRNMGLSPKSGSGLTALAALKKFGIVEDRGQGSNRMVGLSELGMRLVLPGNPTQEADMRTTAFNPPIYKELWDELGPDLPDDMTLGWRLRQRGFSESGIAEFIPRFRETVSLLPGSGDANLGGDGDGSGEREDKRDPQPSGTGTREPIRQAFRKAPMTATGGQSSADLMVIPIPLGLDGSAALQIPTQMSKAAWGAMKAIIDAYEHIVVVSGPSQATVQPAESEGDGQPESS
jgi:hypothetical protein